VTVYFLTPLKWPGLNRRILTESARRLSGWQRQWVIAKLIKKHKITVVHTYSSFPDTWDALTAKKTYKLQFKLVKRMAGLFWATQLESGRLSTPKIASIFKNTDSLCFVSKGLENLYREKCKSFGIRVEPEKHRVVDIGIDLDFHCPGKQRSLSKIFTIVCVARFKKYQKRQDLLIRALERLKEENIHIAFVGGGPKTDHYKKLVQECSLGNQVTFHGYLTGKNFIDVVRSADLFALPTEFEGRSKALAEAMGMKLPVMASDVQPLNRHIHHNETGFLVENSVEKWAQAISERMQDKTRLSEVAQKGYEHVHRYYNADKNIADYINIFKRV
jgi:glycosyltransferase involved in cell wall biosynthesis